MKKVIKCLILSSTFVVIMNGDPVKKILESDQISIQRTANILMLFVTKTPHDADEILNAESSRDEISQAKSAVLYAIQTICPINDLNQLQLESDDTIKKYEESFNRLYKKICLKLDKRFRKIIYGPHKGRELPKNLQFFMNKNHVTYNQPEEQSLVWNFISGLFC